MARTTVGFLPPPTGECANDPHAVNRELQHRKWVSRVLTPTRRPERPFRKRSNRNELNNRRAVRIRLLLFRSVSATEVCDFYHVTVVCCARLKMNERGCVQLKETTEQSTAPTPLPLAGPSSCFVLVDTYIVPFCVSISGTNHSSLCC